MLKNFAIGFVGLAVYGVGIISKKFCVQLKDITASCDKLLPLAAFFEPMIMPKVVSLLTLICVILL